MALLSKLSNKRSQGSLYEQKARVYLETQGLKFIAANQTFKCGELDLVMTDGDTIVFAFEGDNPPLWLPNFLG